MKLKLHLLAGTILVGCLTLPVGAQSPASTAPTPAPTPTATPNATTDLGAEKQLTRLIDVEIKNFQDESLGSVADLGIDLINGRIVEVLVVSGDFLGMGGKTVAVPPRALISDPTAGCYRLNVSLEVFQSAPAIDLSKWIDAGRSDRVAAAYYLFGQVPYFLENGDTPSKTDQRPKVLLGYVERSSRMLELPVTNLKNEKLGKVWALSFDIPKGRIQNVIVIAPGTYKTKSIVPAMALRFNDTRDGLLLDDSKVEFADEPRYVFNEASYGQKANAKEEAYTGPHTTAVIEQGSSYRDVDLTVLINKNIRTAKLNARNVEIGTINGRVTLRGWVNTEDDKRRIGEIAIAATRLEVVDNQITVGKPIAAK